MKHPTKPMDFPQQLPLFSDHHRVLINGAFTTPPGTLIQVDEVKHLREQHRLRARLAHPAGWITLENPETGKRLGGSVIRWDNVGKNA